MIFSALIVNLAILFDMAKDQTVLNDLDVWIVVEFFQAINQYLFLGKNTYRNQEKLRMYVNCMCKELSVRQSAKICGITVPTAFAWRHKILNALRNTCEHQMLSGTVELDRTFF